MSSSTETGVLVDTANGTTSLRNLYYVRFGFAIVWAGLITLVAATISPASVGLLLVYPLFDVAAAVIDVRTSGASRPRTPLYANIALSVATVIGLAAVASSGVPNVLRVWDAWAITAGAVQLVVAILRYRLGGQWAMILSGAISTLAGTGFILQSGAKNASFTNLAGYAALGGIFFLVSAIRLHRRAR